jgi:hypothetical protein
VEHLHLQALLGLHLSSKGSSCWMGLHRCELAVLPQWEQGVTVLGARQRRVLRGW